MCASHYTVCWGVDIRPMDQAVKRIYNLLGHLFEWCHTKKVEMFRCSIYCHNLCSKVLFWTIFYDCLFYLIQQQQFYHLLQYIILCSNKLPIPLVVTFVFESGHLLFFLSSMLRFLHFSVFLIYSAYNVFILIAVALQSPKLQQK